MLYAANEIVEISKHQILRKTIQTSVITLLFSYDYLRIANHYQTIGTYCGQRSGLNVRVTGNYAVITFRSDGSVRYRGYQLYFSYVPHCKCSENSDTI